MSSSGVPSKCPSFSFHFCPDDRPHLLGTMFPDVPGLPPITDTVAGHLTAAAVQDLGDPKSMPLAEWTSTLRTIAGELERAEYHRRRFDDVVQIMKARRVVAGGPVFGDPGPAAALYNEAAACMAALRTAVDVIIYAAARRNGATEQLAEEWDATKAICPKPGSTSPKYDVDDVRALRHHRDWYEKLNHYRNGISHRGWHDRSFGYYESWEDLPEARDPKHNAMLAPDYASLRNRKRPHAWTYQERVWLDALLTELNAGAAAVVKDLMPIWQIATAPKGTIPIEQQPNVFLTVPLVRPLSGGGDRIAIFESRAAFRTFERDLAKQGFQVLNAQPRPVRRSTLPEGKRYIVACERSKLGPRMRLCFFGLKSGTLAVNEQELDTEIALGGAIKDVLFFDLPTHTSDVVYILDAK